MKRCATSPSSADGLGKVISPGQPTYGMGSPGVPNSPEAGMTMISIVDVGLQKFAAIEATSISDKKGECTTSGGMGVFHVRSKPGISLECCCDVQETWGSSKGLCKPKLSLMFRRPKECHSSPTLWPAVRPIIRMPVVNGVSSLRQRSSLEKRSSQKGQLSRDSRDMRDGSSAESVQNKQTPTTS